MIVILARRDRPPPGTDDQTDDEKLRLFDTMAAYAGSYTVHDDRLVHHIDIAWNQSWVDPTRCDTSGWRAAHADVGANQRCRDERRNRTRGDVAQAQVGHVIGSVAEWSR